MRSPTDRPVHGFVYLQHHGLPKIVRSWTEQCPVNNNFQTAWKRSAGNRTEKRACTGPIGPKAVEFNYTRVNQRRTTVSNNVRVLQTNTVETAELRTPLRRRLNLKFHVVYITPESTSEWTPTHTVIMGGSNPGDPEVLRVKTVKIAKLRSSLSRRLSFMMLFI